MRRAPRVVLDANVVISALLFGHGRLKFSVRRAPQVMLIDPAFVF
jgi:predicted nucleic acid-binding protein